MQATRHSRPSPALVISFLALFVALGGTSYALRNANVNAAKVDGLNAVKSKVTTTKAAGKLVATEKKARTEACSTRSSSPRWTRRSPPTTR